MDPSRKHTPDAFVSFSISPDYFVLIYTASFFCFTFPVLILLLLLFLFFTKSLLNTAIPKNFLIFFLNYVRILWYS